MSEKMELFIKKFITAFDRIRKQRAAAVSAEPALKPVLSFRTQIVGVFDLF